MTVWTKGKEIDIEGLNLRDQLDNKSTFLIRFLLAHKIQNI